MNTQLKHAFGNKIVCTPASYLLMCILIYGALSAVSIINRAPWFDEGAYANIGYNLLNHGHLGIAILTSQLEYWPKANYYTFSTTPFSFVLQAGWYFLFDFGLIQLRSLSALFGLILILSIYVITKKLFQNSWVAIIVSLLVASDYNIITWATDGRMDIISAGFGFFGLALYITMRETRLSCSLILSQLLIVLSGLSHPAGVVYFVGLWVLVIFFDRKRLRIRHIFYSALPYIFGFLGWGSYIIQDYEAFSTQFFGNFGTRHTSFIFQPFFEFNRYFSSAFGLGDQVEGLTRLKIVPLVIYWGSFILMLTWPRLRKDSKSTPVLIVLITTILTMAIILAGKHLSYLVHIIPLYATLTGAVLWMMFRKKSVFRLASICIITLIICLQGGGTIAKYTLGYVQGKNYEQTVSLVSKLRVPNDLIIASSEFGFAFGYEGEVIDDIYLGTRGGVAGDIIVINDGYRKVYREVSKAHPKKVEYIFNFLRNEYSLIRTIGHYEIYVSKKRDEYLNLL